ncbi:hypothetical protein PINS_up005313 [Pythium insidiosum]|nr:hypothetical protein PINS_up005313 [Pythium insidiosum]
MRVDRWLRQEFPSLSNAFLQRQLRQRKIRLVPPAAASSSPVASKLQPNTLLTSGMTVAMDAYLYETISRERDAQRSPRPSSPRASGSNSSSSAAATATATALVEELLGRVLHEDANYVVLHKPPGLAVQVCMSCF